MKKKNFIRNLGLILSLGIVGTILSMIIISVFVSYFNSIYNWVSPRECLLIASVMCSTDTVAVLTLITADKYRKLNSVLFGEGVINDAVAILLFKAIENLTGKHEEIDVY